MLALAFPSSGALPGSDSFGLLALGAYVPLLSWAMGEGQHKPPGFVFAISLATHLIAYGVAFHWVAFHPNSITVAASIGGVMTLALLASGPLALAAWVAERTSVRWLLPTWAVSVLGLEHLLSVGPWALPWPVLSMTQAALPHAVLARWIGGPGLTAIVLLANALGAAAFYLVRRRSVVLHTKTADRRRKAVSWMIAVSVLTGVIILPRVFPVSTGSDGQEPHSSARPSLLLVQPGTPSETWAQVDTAEAVDALIRQTRQALHADAGPAHRNLDDGRRTGRRTNFNSIDGGPPVYPNAEATDVSGADVSAADVSTADVSPAQIVVWPETALPPFYFAITEYREGLTSILQPRRPLLAGAVLPDSGGTSTYDLYRNAALWISRKDSRSDRHRLPDARQAPRLLPQQLRSEVRVSMYAKHHLVPFAERVPFVDEISILRHLTVPSGGVAGYVPGPGPVSFPPRSFEASPAPFTLLPLICFETVIGPYVRSAARAADRRRPTAFVALSHVGWWGDSAVLPQYRALTRLRAMETGVPIVVATVRSPAFTAHPNGDVSIHTRWMQKTTTYVTPPASNVAPFVRWASWIDLTMAAVLFASIAVLTDPLVRERSS